MAAYVVKINEAPEELLRLIPRVGEKRAQKIVEFRNKYGSMNKSDLSLLLGGLTEHVLAVVDFSTKAEDTAEDLRSVVEEGKKTMERLLSFSEKDLPKPPTELPHEVVQLPSDAKPESLESLRKRVDKELGDEDIKYSSTPKQSHQPRSRSRDSRTSSHRHRSPTYDRSRSRERYHTLDTYKSGSHESHYDQTLKLLHRLNTDDNNSVGKEKYPRSDRSRDFSPRYGRSDVRSDRSKYDKSPEKHQHATGDLRSDRSKHEKSPKRRPYATEDSRSERSKYDDFSKRRQHTSGDFRSDRSKYGTPISPKHQQRFTKNLGRTDKYLRSDRSKYDLLDYGRKEYRRGRSRSHSRSPTRHNTRDGSRSYSSLRHSRSHSRSPARYYKPRDRSTSRSRPHSRSSTRSPARYNKARDRSSSRSRPHSRSPTGYSRHHSRSKSRETYRYGRSPDRYGSKRERGSRPRSRYYSRSRSSSRDSLNRHRHHSNSSESDDGYRYHGRSSSRHRGKYHRSARGDPKKLPKNLKFDGKSSWLSFKQKFDSYRDVMRWSDSESRDYLIWSLEGKALHFFSVTAEMSSYSFHRLMKKLEYRFGDKQLIETARVKFQQAYQNSEESLEDWSDRVLTLATAAFRDLPESYCTREVISKFCQGCLDREAGKHACLERPRDMQSALDAVKYYQYISQAVDGKKKEKKYKEDYTVNAVSSLSEARVEQMISKAIDGLAAKIKQLKSADPEGNPKETDDSLVCWFCKIGGHMKKECRRYQRWKERQRQNEQKPSEKKEDLNL